MPDVPFLDLAPMTREIRAALDAAWDQALTTSGFVGGPAVEAFEQAWADYCGTTQAVGVANGTDALELVLRALDIGPGDEVVVPANTFVATAEAVVLAGATPRFADVDPETLLLTPDSLAEALTPRTRAVLVVHLYGQVADMDALLEATSAAGILLIEDAAQAHGATWRGRPAGSFGVAGGFSFYPGKNLGAFGDGGAVVTSDPALAARLRVLRDHGRALGTHYEHAELGRNSRLDALQAAVLSAKLPRLDAWNAARRAVVQRYEECLDGELLRGVRTAPGAEHVHHLAVVRSPEREAVRALLHERGVRTATHYPTPCHLQPPYRQFADRPLPVAERAAGEILSLPVFPHMTDEQVDQVCAALLAASRTSVIAYA
jgi:dTDP-4-amino-4,6-dideoxygalactose transaminase